MKRKIELLFLSIVFGAAIFVASSTAVASDVIRWKLQTVDDSGLPSYQELAVAFCEKVKEVSNGRLIITPYPAGAIVPSFQVWDAMRKGMIDISYHFLVYWRGKECAVTSPNEWITKVSEYQSDIWLHAGGGAELMRKALEPHGLYFLGFASGDWGECLYSRVPLNSVEDLKGKKARAAGLAADMLAELGASVVTVPGAEVYQALSKGVVDCAEFTNQVVNYNLGLHEVAPYIIFPPYSGGGNYDWFVNLKKWNSLPADLKAIVETCMMDVQYRFSLHNRLETEKVNKKLRSMKNVTCIDWTEEDMAKIEEARVKSLERKAEKCPLFKEIETSRLKTLRILGYKGKGYSWEDR